MKKKLLLIVIFYFALIISSYSAASSSSRSSNYDKGASIIKKGKKLEEKGKIEKANKRYEKALEYLIKSNKEKPNQPDTLNYLGFALRKLGNFEEAEHAIDGFEGSNIEYSKAMLHALIHSRKREIQLAQGKTEKARVELEKYRVSLSLAIAADEKNPVPYIRLCRSLINEFALTRDTALLEEALQVSDQGSVHNESYEEFAIVRTDVLQADGQLRLPDR